jgi:6-pyruvoyltetrahydropterin/6-carboxytetrahydropterin synthase
MFTLKKTFRFEAAHQLPHHDGKCARLHGHSFVLHVHLEGKELVTEGPKSGMLCDFGDVSAVVKPYVDGYLDHHFLNGTTGLENPTSEELARWLFGKLAPQMPLLQAVEIEETCTSACCYTPFK